MKKLRWFVGRGTLIAVILLGYAWATQLAGVNRACPPACPVSFTTLSILVPASDEAARIQGLFNFIVAIAAIIFVLVEGVLFFAVFRYRNRPPETAMQFHGNTKLELAWTAAPAVILAVLLGFTLQTMGQVKAVPTSNALNVKVIGHQWWWEFRFPDLNIVTANELVVPDGRTIEVAVESVDVIHGFWSPELFGKVDAIPGYANRVRFTPLAVGTYGGACTQFCGIGHAQMRLAVIVKSEADFQAWVANQQLPAAPATGDAVAGEQVFLNNPCAACHSIQGTAAAGQIGPNLTHLASRSFIAGGVLINTPENLKIWLKDPQAVKPGVKMPNLGLNDQDINKLVVYLMTLK